MSKSAKLAPPKKDFWKARGKDGKSRKIPFTEMSDDHIQRAFFITQNKELELFNKMTWFAELGEGLQAEAERRNLKLRSITNEPGHKIKGFFRHSKVEKNDTIPNEEHKGLHESI